MVAQQLVFLCQLEAQMSALALKPRKRITPQLIARADVLCTEGGLLPGAQGALRTTGIGLPLGKSCSDAGSLADEDDQAAEVRALALLPPWRRMEVDLHANDNSYIVPYMQVQVLQAFCPARTGYRHCAQRTQQTRGAVTCPCSSADSADLDNYHLPTFACRCTKPQSGSTPKRSTKQLLER
jgi:hypothetical protein